MKTKAKLVLIFIPILAGVFALGVHYRGKKVGDENSRFAYQPVTWSEFAQGKHFRMLLEGFGIVSMIDIPSVDVDSLKTFNLPLKKYIGVASSSEEAAALQEKFGSVTSSFSFLDMTIDSLPRVDLILCWDKFFYLSARDRQAALLQCKKSGAKFIMLMHCPQLEENREGAINWKLPPYSFPEPMLMIQKKQSPSPEYLALWNLLELP